MLGTALRRFSGSHARSRHVIDITRKSCLHWMRFMSMLDRFTADRHDALQELDHRAAENVVAVSSNHVARVRYVDVLAVRTQPQKILRARFGQDIGAATANEQRGQ